MKCASFFAGVGGIDLGFERAGFEIIYANEFDKNAVITYNANHRIKVDERSITDVATEEIPNFDVLLAGFPCQAFSIAGYRKGFADAGRGDLFFELVRIAKERKPKIIFLENVKNLCSHDKGNTFKVILEQLNNLGYHVTYKVINASEYSDIPQNRERIYIVAFLNKNDSKTFKFPEKLELVSKIKDYLEDEDSIDKRFYYNNRTPFFDQLAEIDNAETMYQWRRKYVRKNQNNLCPTLTANMGTGGHNVPLLNVQGNPDTIRKLTPRECFNFQGFPADFILPEISNSNLYKQAGNSVVVPVIERIAKQIKKALDK